MTPETKSRYIVILLTFGFCLFLLCGLAACLQAKPTQNLSLPSGFVLHHHSMRARRREHDKAAPSRWNLKKMTLFPLYPIIFTRVFYFRVACLWEWVIVNCILFAFGVRKYCNYICRIQGFALPPGKFLLGVHAYQHAFCSFLLPHW